MAFVVPPHLARVPDPAETYAKGVALGQQLRVEEARLAAEAQQAAMQAALRQQQIQMQALRDAQELEIQKTQVAIQTEMKQRQLSMVQQRLDLETSKAAKAYEARQQFNQWRASGGDPLEGLMRFGMDMGMAPSDLADVARWSSAPKTAAGIEEFSVQGTKVPFLKVPRPEGGFSYQKVDVPEGTPEGGSLKSYPITDESGQVRPGWFATQGSGGRMIAHKESAEQIQLARQEVARLQKDRHIGKYLIAGEAPPETAREEVRKKYNALKPEYDQWKAVLDAARRTGKGMATDVPQGATGKQQRYGISVSGVRGPMFDSPGGPMIYLGNDPHPLTDTDEDNWEPAKKGD